MLERLQPDLGVSGEVCRVRKRIITQSNSIIKHFKVVVVIFYFNYVGFFFFFFFFFFLLFCCLSVTIRWF